MSNKSTIEFPMDGDDALFDANDSIRSGTLRVRVSRGCLCPVSITFKRGKKKCSFALDGHAARKLAIYLIAEGI